ncbi:MAG: 4Fe-4S binding protein [Spirochaetes bacterium]|nr:4Fe-4S binding protein [Spirochaetota bacterium]MBU1079210.1 4Fe-4S binding protein [Spirochaetota bacterium]
MTTRTTIQSAISIAFVLAVAVGGFYYPLIGFAVALVMVVALAMTLARPKSFCAYACPRGKALGLALRPFSRGKPLPRGFASPTSKRALCGFMMFCVIGNIARLAEAPQALGTFFWGLCVISLAAGVVIGLIYRPRAWCAVCPMGTLQETVGAVGLGKRKEA